MSGARKPSSWYRQSGVIAVRFKDGAPQVLLVTSFGGKRWVLPKGVVEKGYSPSRSAAKEAWEEAGVTGRISRRLLGRYCYEKWRGSCTVLIYRLDVDEVHRAWPERHARLRKWFTPAKAAARVGDPAIGALILATAKRRRSR